MGPFALIAGEKSPVTGDCHAGIRGSRGLRCPRLPAQQLALVAVPLVAVRFLVPPVSGPLGGTCHATALGAELESLSTSGMGPEPSAPKKLPTAVHYVGRRHEIHDSELRAVGFGVCWIVQRFPFQRSANVFSRVACLR